MPKRVDHQERRELIAAALMRVAASQGLESVSLRHVAAEAGLTAGAVQHYFASKDAMMRFAMDTASARIGERMAVRLAAMGEAATPRDVVHGLLTTLLPTTSSSATEDLRVALAFMAYAATRPEVSATLEHSNTQMREVIAAQVHRAIAQGQARASRHPELTAATLLALTDGLAVQMLSANLTAAAATAILEAQIDQSFGNDHDGGRV